jgi:lipoyl(octanoyl) transferase
LPKSEPKTQIVRFHDLGLISYAEAWDFQEKLFHALVNRKTSLRGTEAEKDAPFHELIFCSHPPVFTLGKSANEQNLLFPEAIIRQAGAEVFKINRGGDITFHGPGQLVAYPIFDLDHFFTDIHRYLRTLEEAIIMTLAEFGIQAGRYPGYTGVWLDPEREDKARKICAMGVRCSRWVTMHGLAFNLNTDLEWFNKIVPCGISDKKVSSLHLELGHAVDENHVKAILLEKMAGLFDFIWEKA